MQTKMNTVWAERGIVEYQAGGKYNERCMLKCYILPIYNIQLIFYRE